MIPIKEPAVDLSRGLNFMPQKARYSLPDKKSNVSVFLISSSFEYDVELIKHMSPSTAINYKNIVIPRFASVSFGPSMMRYNLSMGECRRRSEYVAKQKLIPPVSALTTYNRAESFDTYISYSDIMKSATAALRNMSEDAIADNIVSLFNNVFLAYSTNIKDKIIVVDTTKFKIFKSVSKGNYKSDLINALITACVLNPSPRLRKFNTMLVFRGENADYKFDFRLFEERDIERIRTMLSEIGTMGEMTSTTDEEAGASVDDFVDTELDEEIPEILEEKEKEDVGEVDDEVKKINRINDTATSSIKNTLNQLATTLKPGGDINPEEPKKDDSIEKDSLYNVKTMDINAKLIEKITPDTQTVNSYNKLSNEITSTKGDTVEDHIMKSTVKTMSKNVVSADEKSVMNTTTSEREREIREKLGKVKLNNVTFNTLTSITDVPKPVALKPSHLSTTCPAAQQGTGFTRIAKEYEEKLLDRDIVATFMNFSKLPDGFYVTDVQVTDVSTPLSLMNNWKVTLRNKSNERQNIINIRIPKVINGRFYNNGIWYNIGKQDFPIPILKINKRTVMLTSNYNKITCDRYDTRSLVDLSMVMKIINKLTDAETGKNKYVRVGNSSNTNSRFVSTIEYDEYARKWVYFINKEAGLEIRFNRVQCQKAYGFVSVQPNEFCCGMLNQVPIIVNTETGLTRKGETLTDILINSLPPELQLEYRKQKPGKLAMYSQITIGVTVPLGVTIAAWEGISSLIKKSGVNYKFVEERFDDVRYFKIPFKDKVLAIESSVPNQLLFNGFYRINTKNYNFAEFETPIMNSNSIYVDIYNNLFFKQYSQLTTFITYYNFFVDPITADVCDHYHIPNDIAGMLIYASNLLADNNHTSENNAALYRIRSSEIIPAIVHYRLAFAISKYNNSVGSKARGNNIAFNPMEVVNELLAVPNVEPMSALNPMVELHMRENITKKGFKGVNSDRSYTVDKRNYEDSMIGKCALSSPNNENVGINRQLVADPKIESVRGYTSTDGPETNFNDLQLASFSELLTPGTVTRDDAIRTAIATSQTSHIVPTIAAEPVLISNGVDEIVSANLTEEFAYVAPEDGSVIDKNDDYLIIQFTKSNKKKAINLSHKPSFNSGSGFYVDNHLITNLEVNDKFKKGDVIAYHEKFFTKGIDGVVRMNVGPLAKCVFANIYSTYEDAGLITHKMSKKLGTSLSMMQSVPIDATDDIDSVVKIGDEVEIGDPLIVFGIGDTGDKSVDNFLKAFQNKDSNSVLDNAKRVVRAKNPGRVFDVRMYTTKSMDRLSPSLYKLLDNYFKANIQRKKILDKYDKTDSVYKLDTLYDLPTEPLKGTTIKGRTCDVLIEIYIEHEDEASVGDKLAMYGASKQVLSEVIPEGLEPYAESTPNEEISLFVSNSSILKRMIPSLVVTASGNKVLVNLKKRMRKIWEEG